MAKGSNPADAFRKAQRAKELKKNKEDRKKVREVQTVKKDTRELEADIRYLKTQTDATSKTKLTELESELSYINRTKEAYVAEHPESRDKVFHIRKPKEGGEGSSSSHNDFSKYDENGRLRDPKRSVYYDPVYNPFGVPPPGMPYMEKPAEEESEEDSSEDDESDDEIIMPEGPPPNPNSESDEESDDSDDIPLPEGPPPPKPITSTPLPPSGPIPPPMRMGFGAPPMPPMGSRPPPRPVPLHAHMHGQGYGGAGPSNFRPPPPRPHMGHNRPPPTIQDPLSDAPTQTYQGHRIAQHALPARPPPSASSNTPSTSNETIASANASTDMAASGGTGEISAAPVLRDLRKEATIFVPRGVKKRKGPGGGVMVNSAPGAGEIDDEGDERKRLTPGNGGLMGKLQGVLGDVPKSNSTKEIISTPVTADDDYQKFLEGLGDLS
ncbi:uncharacterized protein IL334_003380 [Kwoniella shivajii]|uniref:Wbp11/ELF5/Saf1 N-terminal domain-containing protein n=1 Tax=Kwoniella shivajii TaxID=564305 RepID=A0ABZ1CZ58_9TREE|nr:hypothetical protein IL334_003380 [Kwoniella shivajii]